MGIIDYLTKYTTAKKIERKFRSFQAPAHTVSVAPPILYGQRFNMFMRSNLFSYQDKSIEDDYFKNLPKHTLLDVPKNTPN